MAAQTLYTLCSFSSSSSFSGLPLHPFRQPFSSATGFSEPPRSLTIAAAAAGPLLPHGRRLRAAVVGGGPAGSSAAEALAAGGVETYLIERAPAGAKPCGGAIPLCMLDEFSLPAELVDRRVTRMRIVSPSNLVVDFGKTLQPGEHIPMLRREVLDAFLRERARSHGAELVQGLVTGLDVPGSPDGEGPYVVRYIDGSPAQRTLEVDVVVGADGANSRVAKAIGAGDYAQAIAFQERIRLPAEKMEHYEDLAEMYVGGDVRREYLRRWDESSAAAKTESQAAGSTRSGLGGNVGKQLKGNPSRGFPPGSSRRGSSSSCKHRDWLGAPPAPVLADTVSSLRRNRPPPSTTS